MKVHKTIDTQVKTTEEFREATEAAQTLGLSLLETAATGRWITEGGRALDPSDSMPELLSAGGENFRLALNDPETDDLEIINATPDLEARTPGQLELTFRE